MSATSIPVRMFSMTGWAMLGEHFKPMDKQVYLNFPKGVMMGRGFDSPHPIQK
jgi:hypothetical protein